MMTWGFDAEEDNDRSYSRGNPHFQDCLVAGFHVLSMGSRARDAVARHGISLHPKGIDPMSHAQKILTKVHGGWWEQDSPRWVRVNHVQYVYPLKTGSITLGFRCWRA